jgi:glycine cleavage system T protein (aminomethyltransferase)
VSLRFLSPSPAALSRSPMERQALAAGASLEQRDGWNVAVRFDGLEAERERARSTVGFADLSHLGKVELQGPQPHHVQLGTATHADGMWWCPYTAERMLVLCDPTDLPTLREGLVEHATGQEELTSVVDVTTAFAALAIGGPLAREVFARFTAIDLRDQVTPVRGFRPGSVARTPGAILREGEQRWLMLFGAALGQYMWTVVADAAESLGGGPVAADALTAVATEAAHA